MIETTLVIADKNYSLWPLAPWLCMKKVKMPFKEKLIRFGQQGVKTNQTAGQREAFKSRHAKNIKRGWSSAAYWADKVKWRKSKTKSPSKKWKKGS